MQRIKVWDPVVRLFHWSLVVLFTANALLTDPEKPLHLWIGYAVAGLVAVRVLWGIVGTRYARFSSFPPSIAGAMEQVGDIRRNRKTLHVGHTPLGAWMIYNLLAAIAVISISGWLMTTNAYWGVKWPEELHEAAVTWAELSVFAHIAAVLFESLRTGINLPRAMITGVKSVPQPRDSDAVVP